MSIIQWCASFSPQDGDFREMEDTAPPIRLREGIDIDELKTDGSMFELQDLNASGKLPQCIVDVASLFCYRIWRHIPLSTAKTISNALISSRLDYCNSLLNNIAKQYLSKLQRVQNCLSRVVLRAPRFSPSLPLLKQLHWLPVNYRIKFKLSTLTYRALAIHQPPYLASILHFSNIPRQLRSSTSQQLSIPRTKLNLGKRAFSVAAPIIWNELPTTFKYCESLASFRKHLKTYLSKLLFPLK